MHGFYLLRGRAARNSTRLGLLWGLDSLCSDVESRRVQAARLTLPPGAGLALLVARGEPVLPFHGAHVLRRPAAERVAGKELQHLRRALQQPQLDAQHPRIRAPLAQRGEPEVPVEARLVGREDSRRAQRALRFVAERIGRPALAVVGALELD